MKQSILLEKTFNIELLVQETSRTEMNMLILFTHALIINGMQ